jgi:hypothetical protein
MHHDGAILFWIHQAGLGTEGLFSTFWLFAPDLTNLAFVAHIGALYFTG